jgi:hypothetical protein
VACLVGGRGWVVWICLDARCMIGIEEVFSIFSVTRVSRGVNGS